MQVWSDDNLEYSKRLSVPLSGSKLDELQLFLHGLDLSYLTDIMDVSTLSVRVLVVHLTLSVFTVFQMLWS